MAFWEDIPDELKTVILYQADNPNIRLVCSKWRELSRGFEAYFCGCGFLSVEQKKKKRKIYDSWGHDFEPIKITTYAGIGTIKNYIKESEKTHTMWGWYPDGKPKYHFVIDYRHPRGRRNIPLEIMNWYPNGRLSFIRSDRHRVKFDRDGEVDESQVRIRRDWKNINLNKSAIGSLKHHSNVMLDALRQKLEKINAVLKWYKTLNLVYAQQDSPQ